MRRGRVGARRRRTNLDLDLDLEEFVDWYLRVRKRGRDGK